MQNGRSRSEAASAQKTVDPRSSEDDEDDDGPEYSLRKRNKDGKSVTRKKRDLEPVLTFGKGWSIPPLPDKGDMRGLSKSQVKKDLKLISRTMEPDILEDMSVRCDGENAWASFVAQSSTRGSTTREMNARSGIFFDEDDDDEDDEDEAADEDGGNESDKGGASNSSSSSSKSSGGKKSSKSGRRPGAKRRARPVADVRRAYTQTKRIGSTNFYYPFKKMKEWEELHNYLDFVNEQTYLSARNAFVQKMAMLLKKREQQQAVLDGLHKVYADRLSSVLALEAGIQGTAPLLDNVLQHVAYYKDRADLALRELNGESGQSAVAAISTGTKSSPRSRAQPRSKSNNAAAEAAASAMDVDDVADDDDDDNNANDAKAAGSEVNMTTAQKLAELRAVHTPYGPGILHAVRADGFLVVKVDWGATVFMKATALTRSSLDHLAEHGSALCDTLEDLLSERAEPTPVNRRPVMYTRPDYGPPRGVPLFLSPLSNDPSFALPAATPLDPVALTRLYRSKNVLATHVTRDFAQEQEFEAADLDLRHRSREQDLEAIPYSWGSTDSTPWGPAGCGIPRAAMDAWEADRIEIARLRSDALQMQRKLAHTTACLRTRDKTVEEEHKAQQRLMAQLHEARTQLALAAAAGDDASSRNGSDGHSVEGAPPRGGQSSPQRKRPRRARSGSKADVSDDTETKSAGTPNAAALVFNGSDNGGEEASVTARAATRRRTQRVS